jgi:hypothetical protein
MSLPFVVIFLILLYLFDIAFMMFFTVFMFFDYENNHYIMKYLCPDTDNNKNITNENALIISIFIISFVLIFRELCRGAAPHKE